ANADLHHQWCQEVRSICGQNIPFFLVGCKSDLRVRSYPPLPPDSCLIPPDEAAKAANSIGARGYYECSASTLNGLDRLMEDAARLSIEDESDPDKSRCVMC